MSKVLGCTLQSWVLHVESFEILLKGVSDGTEVCLKIQQVLRHERCPLEEHKIGDHIIIISGSMSVDTKMLVSRLYMPQKARRGSSSDMSTHCHGLLYLLL